MSWNKTLATTPSGTEQRIDFYVTGYTNAVAFTTVEPEAEAAKRVVGLTLVTHLPAPALDEAVESLCEIWAFNRSSDREIAQPMVVESGSGSVVQGLERRSLQLSE